MAYMQTPQRPVPGAFMATPAISRYQNRNSDVQSAQTQPSQPTTTTSQASSQVQARPSEESLSPVERAARTVNETLTQELRYPELDNYVAQGISSEYDISQSASWAPFQQTKLYQIPDKVLDQYNRAQVSTMMGLFADIHHAWVSIDNALYLWDYTNPNPELIGFEDQANSITAVRLLYPRKNVFVDNITRLLVIATTVELIILGVGINKPDESGESLSLYRTKMTVPARGLDVTTIEGSQATGRIFFSGNSDNDVYELTYQQEEKWFFSRCSKVNHTRSRLSAITPSFIFSTKVPPEYTIQMIIDDSRELLYTLSSASNIRIFRMRANAVLELAIDKPLKEILNHIGHMISQTELISTDMKIIAIYPIPSSEASKLHVMAITSTGCRIFLSATTSFGYLVSDKFNAPMSMQVHHVKFPPAVGTTVSQFPAPQPTDIAPAININSKSLTTTHAAARYGPGFFFCFVAREDEPQHDKVFISAPDPGRIVRPQESAALTKYCELGLWMPLSSRAEDIGLVTPPFAASGRPEGFANELAVQFSQPVTEVAILTNDGIYIQRRQRLVDMFVTAIRMGRNEEGLDGAVKNFIRLYGRSETTATALAVACGQGLEVVSDYRVATITDTTVVERARSAFIEYGGKPHFNENTMFDRAVPTADMVKPSPRHDGLALYLSRLVRAFWKSNVVEERISSKGVLTVESVANLNMLKDVQQDLTKLKEFLDANKNFIEGLGGPEALARVATKQQEVALIAEHRALHSLVSLISNIIEGISFVQMLFDERMDEIVLSLSNESRQQVRNLTYENLFSTPSGKDIAKELVKAIVNRNILNGANVDTVADALRRRCGSFCSAGDVIIFKAQEQLKRAAEAGCNTELGRNLLNESLRLFKEVAEALSFEQLHSAVEQYVRMEFYAGAIELALNLARELDKENRALIWIQNGRPQEDPGVPVFQSRKRCYDLIHQVIIALDRAPERTAEMSNEDSSLTAKRKAEAYEVIDTSSDEVFQTDLYDWYLDQGQAERLLTIQSPYVITYLRRRFLEDITIADLLWRCHSQAGRTYDAAEVLLELARSDFDLSLDQRVEYLSRAKANALTTTIGVKRANRRMLNHDINDLLDVASIQGDLLQKFGDDPRCNDENRRNIFGRLNNKILPIQELYHDFADRADYHDICLLIYQAADHRNPTDIRDTWRNLLNKIHQDTERIDRIQPYEAVADKVRTLGGRLKSSESVFPVSELMFLLKQYAFVHQRDIGQPHWVVDVFIDLQIPYETIYSVLDNIANTNELPFQGANKHYIVDDILYVVQKWFHDSSRGITQLFGGEDNASAILDNLQHLMTSGLSAGKREECEVLRMRIASLLR